MLYRLELQKVITMRGRGARFWRREVLAATWEALLSWPVGCGVVVGCLIYGSNKAARRARQAGWAQSSAPLLCEVL